METPNTMPVLDDFGQEHIMTVFLTFEDESKERKFALLMDPNDEEGNVYPYEYDDDGNMDLVTDEKDLDMCAEVLSAFQDEEM